MELRRRKRAAAVAFAVVASALGTVPAVAAPHRAPASAGDREAAGTGVPAVWPRPQSLRAAGGTVAVTDEVVLVLDAAPTTAPGVTPTATGAAPDPYALDALRALLREAGARTVTTVREGEAVPAGALVVRVGEEPAPAGPAPGASGPGAVSPLPLRPAASLDGTLTALGASPRADLPSGGYRLAVGRVGGRDAVALAGVGGDGLFHAVQTLRQLTAGAAPGPGRIAGAVVRDWPGTAVRGTTEGFYGTPWTHGQRLAQLDFMARTKQNRYVYAPGDDLYRQARWREAYPARQRAEFQELADRARRDHVTLAWTVAPGQAMCFSSEADVRALTRKADAMWALGFRAFQLQFQDVSYSEWHCHADAEAFGSGPEAAARAQARVANAMARHLAARHPGAAALSLMPTEYYQDGSTEYRAALAAALDEGVEVAWTGVGVVPRTITGRELARTRAVFGGHPLVTMDNYPVNDYAQDRVFLGPYTGREPAVATGSAALLANAMQQPRASRIPLFTAADYAWNPRDYRPRESWQAAIADLAGGDAGAEGALRALAGNDASSVLGGDESAYLRPLVEAFWRTRTTPGGAAGSGADGGGAARRLSDAFTVMRQAPGRLGDAALAEEVAPWTEQLARYGEAGETAVAMLRAQTDGDATTAWRDYRALGRLRDALAASRVTVGKGVLDPFLKRAAKAYEAWAGLGHEPAADKGAAGDGRTVRFPRVRALDAVTVLADPGTTGTVEAHVPGEGWRRVGDLAPGGATETGRVERADGVRVTGADASRVRHLVPWYAESADASVELERAGTDVEIGGGRRVTVRLTSLRPSDVRGRLTAKAPAGIEVRVPGASTLPRGTSVDVPVEITVPPRTPSGTYEVPLTFGGTTRTLTVRAFPGTAGPDVARTGTASSSADETKDFPARAANDGDPDTRWSSPAEDGAWWQVELAAPVRLGRVVLRWQDAYASGYRVQVSADGRTWRTAATVRDGRGGEESVRMDERDVRWIRVQGDKRATRYGYSLWSVGAYAVAD
ncbi:beta-N-acetylglucosaminidase domain-containing protein [Streptomyces sp. NPDC008313]|uniref:beta-N-acetylglucosaminidase domain-containing protein n=1 Tax=Streptomyces sp. NPDC008313 TaxID=3364826 RepID=UPI0036E450E2